MHCDEPAVADYAAAVVVVAAAEHDSGLDFAVKPILVVLVGT